VLVTGAGGQLGCELVAAFGAAGHDVIPASHADLDVADRDQVLGAVTALHPAAVVHAAAWTDVDGCQLDPDRALRVNALGTRHVADGARRAGAHLCYLSTDSDWPRRGTGCASSTISGAARRPPPTWPSWCGTW
jgi:dTDP-4-dehydrorhamnose reductase